MSDITPTTAGTESSTPGLPDLASYNINKNNDDSLNLIDALPPPPKDIGSLTSDDDDEYDDDEGDNRTNDYDNYSTDHDDDDDDDDDTSGGDEEGGSGLVSQSGTGVLAKKETALVNCSKMAVVMVVSFLAAVVGASVYYYVQRQEFQNYHKDVRTVLC